MRLQDGNGSLRVAIVAGLVVRAAVLAQTGGLGTPIVDEQHYTQIAVNMPDGNGFAWAPDNPTSIRPPLYPGFVGANLGSGGRRQYQAVRLVQMSSPR